MLRINDVIFSLDILQKKFRCNLSACNGNCCRYGDSGAPLNAAEVKIIADVYPEIKHLLRHEGIDAIETQGTSVRDFENDSVTPLVGNEECAYALIENGIHLCGIEKAFEAGIIDFIKPVSCHLFPARVKYYSNFTAVNYQELPICATARKNGKAGNMYLYEFLKEPLIRAFGRELYNELCIAAVEMRKNKTLLRRFAE
ncbi:MAG: DUF3109 family protein [Bacteroidales bacterium]|jgi:hypothetical protein|nr:DUF3109 family protein [Bacteroidales bacterium]